MISPHRTRLILGLFVLVSVLGYGNAHADICATDPLASASKPCIQTNLEHELQEANKHLEKSYSDLVILSEANLPGFIPNDQRMLYRAIVASEDAWIKNRKAQCGLRAMISNSGLSNNSFEIYADQCNLELTNARINEIEEYLREVNRLSK